MLILTMQQEEIYIYVYGYYNWYCSYAIIQIKCGTIKWATIGSIELRLDIPNKA